MIRRRSSRVGRSPATRPPRSEPAENPASATPASARLPCVSANAGTAISTAPKPRPRPMHRSAIVRTPIADRAPSRELCVLRRGRGGAHRRDAARTRTSRPLPGPPRRRPGRPGRRLRARRRAAARRRRSPPAAPRRARTPSWRRPPPPPSARSSAAPRRRAASSARAAAVATAIAAIGASTAPRIATTPKRDGIEHHAAPQHEPRTATIDLAAPVRRADRDGDAVGRGDETRLAVRSRRHRGRAARAPAPPSRSAAGR